MINNPQKMEDDVDIYADLPSFSLNPKNNDQNCNCKELKKELNLLISKFESVEQMKTNLEKNLSSLLKTAKAEIARKDKMIDNLRKQLDDITFRRGNRSEASGFSTHRLPHQHTAIRKYENVSSTYSQEGEIELHQIQFHCDEYKNKKPQTDVNQITTLFGERLQKRIMEDEKEEKKQKALLKLNVETKTEDIPKNNVENDKENGSQFSINNDESNIEQRSTSEPLEKNSYKKNLMKRTNEEDDTHKHKRLKIENSEETIIEEIDYNYFTRYDLTDDPVQHEIKNSLTKFEDRSNAAYSLKKEEVPICVGRRAASEYRDMKHDQSCTNRLKNDTRNNSTRDHDNSNIKNDYVDNLRNSRTASTSNYVSEGFNSSYKKNGYRHSPSRRSYSRSRSDYESSSSHRLRESSRRTYREKKYDDYKYDSRYKNSRLKRNHKSEENDRKTRYRRGERDGLRDKSRYSSSDEDRESNSSYRNKKYENRKSKKETINVSNKKFHESNKVAAETNFRESSSRTIVNNITNCVEKNIEQHKVKNEEIKSKNSIKNASARIMKNSDILEEGEILDSPEKKNNSAKISKDNKKEIKENNVRNIPVEDKDENISVNVSDKSTFQNHVNNTKQSEAAENNLIDINTKKIEVVTCLQQKNSKDCKKIIQLSSNENDMAVDDVYNCKKDKDPCKSYITEDLMDSIAQNIGAIEQVRDTDIDDDKDDVDKTSKDFTEIIETAKIEETIVSNIESITKIKELKDSNIESATKKEEMDNPNIESVVEVTEVNNFNSNNKIDDDELRTSTVKTVTNVQAVFNCDIEDRDKSQASIESEILHQTSNKSNVAICLNDHNYVQNPFVNVSDLDAIQKLSSRSECGKAVPETSPKKTKVEKIIDVQSVNGVKRTVLSVVKRNDQRSKGILISHRRKAVKLSDSNASMTVLINANSAKTSSRTDNCEENDSASKPRACKTSRVKLTRCKNNM